MAVQGLQIQRFGFSQPRGVASRAPRKITPMQPGAYRPTSTTAVGRAHGSSMSLAPFGQSTSNATAPPTPQQNVQQTQTANTQAGQQANQQLGYEADPILAQIRAMGRADVGTARASATAGRRKLLTEHGDETFARGVLKDSPADDPIFAAIRDNAFSITKNMARDKTEATTAAEDSFNKAGLHYGGARIKGLGDLETSFLERGNAAQGAVRGKLDEIEQALILAEQESLQSELDYLMNNNYDPGYGGDEPRPDYGDDDSGRALSPGERMQQVIGLASIPRGPAPTQPRPRRPRREGLVPIKTWFG